MPVRRQELLQLLLISNCLANACLDLQTERHTVSYYWYQLSTCTDTDLLLRCCCTSLSPSSSHPALRPS
jgi:hypothetical protein